ncbi:MAG: 23S rRNA pseudouridine1911/1915/1917 synthase [Vicingaceae bacterium]|jgi:23S rRNA pseudouridine1911/1915/1917 synthase
MIKNQFQVIFEDNHLLAVNKPSGMLSQGDRTKDAPISELAKQYIKEKYKKPGEVYLGLPHRIDRPTSGLLLLAKTSKALARLNKMFQDKEIQKTYWAVVKNRPEKDEDTLVHFLVRNSERNKSTAHKKEIEGSKRAELSYKVKLSLDNYHLLEIYPKTGRHHQIRSQLAAIGSPIKGDIKYGFDRTNSDASIHLHARSIAFIHPVSKEKQKISAPAPKSDAVWKACSKLLKG